MPIRRNILALIAPVWILVAACLPAATSPEPTSSPAEPPADVTPLSVGLGFIKSVQFAPFYRADQAGYYDAAGLDVTFRHGTDYDVIALVGQGELDLGLADGTSVTRSGSILFWNVMSRPASS